MKAILLTLTLSICCSVAQVQTAWIRTYHNDLPGKTNQPVAVKLDASGNIIVAGSSQNTAGDSDYVVLKYAPDGTKLWEARYASPASGQDQVRACVLDPSDSVYVTGTSKTLKYSSSGAVLWEAPYGGRDLCWAKTNLYVTGFSEIDFATAKLNALNGTNMWTRYWGFSREDISQEVEADDQGNVYVVGANTWICAETGCSQQMCLIKYASTGVPIWTNSVQIAFSPSVTSIKLKVMALGVYSIGDFSGFSTMYTQRVGTEGQGLWHWDNNTTATTGEMAVGPEGDVYVVGAKARYPVPAVLQCNKITNGRVVWSRTFPPGDSYYAFGKAVALNSREDVIVAGHCNLPDKEDMLTLKYSNDGKELWARHYNGAANGNDRAVALAVAPDDSIYVAGYSATAEGGTEMVLIKYVEPRVNATPKTSGDVQIQMNGVPGSRYAFQSSGDLQTWLNLSTNTTDATGQATFTDTNASNLYPFRFYRSLLLP